MCTPARSVFGHIIVGAFVGEDKPMVYTRKLSPFAKRDDIRKACQELREEIHKNHPGIKEEFTMLRPNHHWN
jgi:hypothetical protein